MSPGVFLLLLLCLLIDLRTIPRLEGCPNTGHRNDGGKEPLELHDLDAQIADGRLIYRGSF